MHPIFVEIRKQLTRGRGGRVGEEWSAEQWWEAFVYTFYYGPKHALQPDADDLLFLVLDEVMWGGAETRYTVIRRMEELPTEFHIGGMQFDRIDWKKTLELNLVMQTTYSLTVAVCNADEISCIREESPLQANGSVRVTKQVYASTVTVGLDASQKKAECASVCYPNICFGVEDFEDAFSSLVLTDEQQRFCVTLCPSSSLTDALSINQNVEPTRVDASTVQPGKIETVPLTDEPTADETQHENPPVLKAQQEKSFLENEDVEFYDPLLNPRDCSGATTSTQNNSSEDDVIRESASDTASSERSRQNRIFGGIVTFDRVQIGLLGRHHCVPRRVLQERIVRMGGPGQEGSAEVFTSIDAEPSTPHSTGDPATEDDSELPWTQKRLGSLRRSVQSARDLLRRVGNGKESTVLHLTEDSKLKFRCSLMTLTLPVALVALKILES